MKCLSRSQILVLHRVLVAQTGGSDGVRDEGMLMSALAAPFHAFAGVDGYPTIYAKAARLGYGIIQNHPFIDGNKRTGTHAMLTFLAINGIELDYTQQELIDVVLSVAAGQIGYEELLDWILLHEADSDAI